MTDPTNTPAPDAAVHEVQGIFPNDAALQDAISRLTLAGFDRAELSLPATNPAANRDTPEMGAAPPTTQTDVRQARTMGTSMAGTIGAFAAAGATVATGGAAGLAIAAAAAVGAGSALAANAAASGVEQAQADERQQSAAAGELVLAVHAMTAARQAEATAILEAAGATRTGVVSRGTQMAPATIDSARWTG